MRLKAIGFALLLLVFFPTAGLAKRKVFELTPAEVESLIPILPDRDRYWCYQSEEAGFIVRVKDRRGSVKAITIPARRVIRPWYRKVRRCDRKESVSRRCEEARIVLSLVQERLEKCERRELEEDPPGDEPEDPDIPDQPDDPGDPEEPNDPGDPEEPKDPEDPEDPENPSDPNDPNDPGDPEDPNNPNDPGDSAYVPYPLPTSYDYYFCDCGVGASAGCVPGSDSSPSNGTSSSTPLQTIAKLRSIFNTAPAGSTFGLCRGGSFSYGGGSFANFNCQANSRCTIRDYIPSTGAQSLPLPLIIHSRAGLNLFAFEDGGAADVDGGYTLANLRLEGAGSGRAVFFFNDVDDVLLQGLEIDNFALGVQIAGFNPPNPGSNGQSDRITLRGSTITNCSGQGFLGGSDDGVIEHNKFFHNGWVRPMLDHDIYWSSSGGSTSRGRIAYNELSNSALGGTCGGAVIVVHGVHNDLMIEGNLLWEDPGNATPACWGIAVDGGYSKPESFNRLVIRNNAVVNVGNLGIGCQGCQNTLIENNVIIQNQSIGTTGIAAPSKTPNGNDVVTTDVTVRNNSVFLGQSGGVGVRLGIEGSGYSAVSNMVLYGGSSSSAFRCFDLNLGISAYTAIDHNLCYSTGTTAFSWNSSLPVSSTPLQDWQANTPFGSSSIDSDPMIRDVSSWDLRPSSASSPLVSNGHLTMSSTDDRDGNARDVAPDIGAYEFQ